MEYFPTITNKPVKNQINIFKFFITIVLILLFLTTYLFSNNEICVDSTSRKWKLTDALPPVKATEDITIKANVPIKNITINVISKDFSSLFKNGNIFASTKIFINNHKKSKAKDNPDKICEHSVLGHCIMYKYDRYYRANIEDHYNLGSYLPFLSDTPIGDISLWTDGITYNLPRMLPKIQNFSKIKLSKEFIGLDAIKHFVSQFFFKNTIILGTYTTGRDNKLHKNIIINSCNPSVLPTLSIHNNSITTSKNDQTLRFNINISGKISGDMAKVYNNKSYIHYYTKNGTAKAGVDYKATSGTLVISKGDTSAHIDVTIKGGGGTGSFYVILDNALGARIARGKATGTIKPAPPTSYTAGPFDAWDTYRNINDRNISTKIVKQNFSLKIVSINSANNATEIKDGIDMQYQLYDMDHHVNITKWMEYNASKGKDGKSAIKIFNIKSARKNVRIRFKFCSHSNNNKGMVLSSLNNCPSTNINTSTFSSDNFAIRPNKFYININTIAHKAGKNYNITFKALNGNNQSTINYIEAVGNSFKVNINETKLGCKTGLFQPNIKSGWHFNNGSYSTSASYSEIGKVQIIIKENKSCFSKFAGVDCKDKNITGYWNTDSNLAITPCDKNITFTPDHFKINAFLSNNKGQNFTYISKDLNMSAILDINVTAETKNNTKTTNYNSACYAHKTDYNISYTSLNISPSNALTKILYLETNTSTEKNNNISSDKISLTNISSSIFSTDNNGTGSIHLKINFDRNTSQAVNPFNINITDINITDINGTKGSHILDENATFYYGRIHAPDYNAKNNFIINNAKIYYEVYCKNCNNPNFFSLGKESVDSVYWYINKNHNSNNSGQIFGYLTTNLINISSIGNVASGVENKIIRYNGNIYPYKEEIDINSSKWLIYNPYNETAKYNSFNVEFYGKGGWAGVGDIHQTVDLNISIKKSKRLEW